MKTIKLFGEIADSYKSEWTLDVQTPAEALRAINANRPGFLSTCDQGGYVAILVDAENSEKSKQITDLNGLDGWKDEVLYIVPKIEGEVGAAIVGAVVSTAFAETVAGVIIATVIDIAVAVAISAVAQMISGTPDGFGANNIERPENKPSYIFNGVVNTDRQGHRVPILYGGPILVGSMVLSSRVNTKDI